jgi:hypothetical protein
MDTTRKNRQTGTLITLTNWNDQWFTICEDHQNAVGHETKTAAMQWTSAPATWCAGCQAKVGAW